MTYWSIIALLVTTLLFGFRRLKMSWNVLPQWLVPENWRANEKDDKTSASVHQQKPDIADGTNDLTPEQVTEQECLESTPKAKPLTNPSPVPTFSLSGHDEIDDEKDQAPASPEVRPIFPAPNSAQRASKMPPPPMPTSRPAKTPVSGLMPPPTRVPPVQRVPPPSVAVSLRAPAGPLPNRGPPVNSQQRASAGLSANGAVKTPNSRNKVLLSPGHSPMDWAALTRSGNLAGVNTFQRVTPSQLRAMSGRKGKPAWSSWQGKVYNITPYLPFHPGGEAELMKAAGRDGTKLFMEVHPWVNWENMLNSCLVGVMVPEDHGMGSGQSSLEDMD